LPSVADRRAATARPAISEVFAGIDVAAVRDLRRAPGWATVGAVKLPALLLALALASGCYNIKTGSEYDYSADFSSYATYAWVTEDLTLIGTGTGNPAIRNEQNETWIREAVDRSLTQRGLEKVPIDEAQLVVTFVVGTKEELRLEGGGTNYGFLGAKGEPPKYYKGSLSIDLFDRATRRQIWHGWASKPLDPGDDPQRVIDDAVARIMAAFPPPKK
jgi:hypothetical protein